ncbi:sugar phosphate isomerase/epimerase family protein [Paenibacillus ginsengarvi]|uniref:Sugar phosphate isomerase/epimerase n=1 Tax=Paenibacillus ginsengarvi TaxID=400777 RepID=A0A3B0CJ22_9BACL|nr:sugar phosphate isomerase/epimerase family protein [Paenibacillus ginsengarvi]RKN85675.1 sugar phosphate isomerase/epimerase [Paenibacillus ginsengarvi]
MKWSLCSTGNRDKPVEYVLNRAAELGLAGIELWTGHIDEYALRTGSVDGLDEEIRRLGLAVPAVSPYAYFSKSDEEREESLAVIEKAAQYAVRFGAPLVRIFFGHLSSKDAPAEMWDKAMKALKKALTIADRYGVNLGLELHNNTFADQIESIRRIFREADHPRLRMIFDGFNLYLDRVDQLEALHVLYGYTDHVHMKSYFWNLDAPETRRPTPVLDGDVDNVSVCQALYSNGYEGFISFEYFGEDGERCVRDSVAELRSRGWMPGPASV